MLPRLQSWTKWAEMQGEAWREGLLDRKRRALLMRWDPNLIDWNKTEWRRQVCWQIGFILPIILQELQMYILDDVIRTDDNNSL